MGFPLLYADCKGVELLRDLLGSNAESFQLTYPRVTGDSRETRDATFQMRIEADSQTRSRPLQGFPPLATSPHQWIMNDGYHHLMYTVSDVVTLVLRSDKYVKQ